MVVANHGYDGTVLFLLTYGNLGGSGTFTTKKLVKKGTFRLTLGGPGFRFEAVPQKGEGRIAACILCCYL